MLFSCCVKDGTKTGKFTPTISSAIKVTEADARPPPPNPAHSVNRRPPPLPMPHNPPPLPMPHNQNYPALPPPPSNHRPAPPPPPPLMGYAMPQYGRPPPPPPDQRQPLPRNEHRLPEYRRKGNQSMGKGGACYRCGELGHHQRECGFTEPIRCGRCFGFGHKENRCATAYAPHNAQFYH